MNVSINGLFPVPVAQIEERSPTEKELSFIKDLETTNNYQNLTSKDKNVLDKEELSDLRRSIQHHIDNYFRDGLGAEKDCSLKITQSWCNYNDADQSHHLHNHPNSAVSGVYYPQADHPNDNLQFHSPLLVFNQVVQFNHKPSMFNAQGCILPVKTGTLFLFPSYLYHSVEPVPDRKSTRISLSFNTFYTGFLGKEQDLTALKIKVED